MTKFSTVLKVRLLLYSQGEILLLHQTKENGGNYTLVGGTIEEEEHARRTLVRESLEEAGIVLKERDLELAHVLHKKTSGGHRMTLYFKTSFWDGYPHSREPHKFKKAVWHSVDALPKNMTATVRHVLEEVKKGNIYSEFRKKKLIKK